MGVPGTPPVGSLSSRGGGGGVLVPGPCPQGIPGRVPPALRRRRGFAPARPYSTWGPAHKETLGRPRYFSGLGLVSVWGRGGGGACDASSRLPDFCLCYPRRRALPMNTGAAEGEPTRLRATSRVLAWRASAVCICSARDAGSARLYSYATKNIPGLTRPHRMAWWMRRRMRCWWRRGALARWCTTCCSVARLSPTISTSVCPRYAANFMAACSPYSPPLVASVPSAGPARFGSPGPLPRCLSRRGSCAAPRRRTSGSRRRACRPPSTVRTRWQWHLICRVPVLVPCAVKKVGATATTRTHQPETASLCSPVVMPRGPGQVVVGVVVGGILW